MVEIAIALGVIGFALVAIIGILPAGLQVQRDNRSETIINQDATFWIDAIRSGARGLNDLTNWVDKIRTPERDFVFGGNGLGSSQYWDGADIISLLTSAVTNGDMEVQAIVTAFSGSAAEKDYNKESRELAFKYRMSVRITNVVNTAVSFSALDIQDPPAPLEPLHTLFELRLDFAYPLTREDRDPPRVKSYRAFISGVRTNNFGGFDYYFANQ